MKSKKFEDLIVWQKSHQVVLEIYKTSSCFPNHELYGITSQLRRSAVSVPTNIAEGFIKLGKKDKIRCFNIAQGSLEETKYLIRLASDLGYSKDSSRISQELDDIGRLLNKYIKSMLASNY